MQITLMKYPVYDIEFDPERDLGMTAISFVTYPAICEDFIYFSDTEKVQVNPGQIIMTNTEKHEIVSPILIPNQLVLRKTPHGECYYVRWSKETIEKVAMFYLMNQFNNNFTIQHEWFDDNSKNYEDTLVSDIYMKRMWIIDDPKTDEANKVYGYHLPKGTLMVHLKVHNRKVWQRIKSGELKGLSIEAFIPQKFTEEITYKKTDKKNMKNPKELFNAFMLWYNQVSEEAKELADVATSDETESGEVSLKYYTSDSDYIEISTDGTAIASDGTVLEDGEYPLADGNVLVIENGKFLETRTVEETKTEEPIEAPVAEAQEDDEEKKEEETETTEEETTEETTDEEKKDEEKQEEVETPAFTLVEIEIAGETFKVPQQVADYIKSLEETAGMTENFRKEVIRLKAVTPTAKPVGAAVKENAVEESHAFTTADLITGLNKKLK